MLIKPAERLHCMHMTSKNMKPKLFLNTANKLVHAYQCHVWAVGIPEKYCQAQIILWQSRWRFDYVCSTIVLMFHRVNVSRAHSCFVFILFLSSGANWLTFFYERAPPLVFLLLSLGPVCSSQALVIGHIDLPRLILGTTGFLVSNRTHCVRLSLAGTWWWNFSAV